MRDVTGFAPTSTIRLAPDSSKCVSRVMGAGFVSSMGEMAMPRKYGQETQMSNDDRRTEFADFY
jgi:hypothetical protein